MNDDFFSAQDCPLCCLPSLATRPTGIRAAIEEKKGTSTAYLERTEQPELIMCRVLISPLWQSQFKIRSSQCVAARIVSLQNSESRAYQPEKRRRSLNTATN